MKINATGLAQGLAALVLIGGSLAFAQIYEPLPKTCSCTHSLCSESNSVTCSHYYSCSCCRDGAGGIWTCMCCDLDFDCLNLPSGWTCHSAAQ